MSNASAGWPDGVWARPRAVQTAYGSNRVLFKPRTCLGRAGADCKLCLGSGWAPTRQSMPQGSSVSIAGLRAELPPSTVTAVGARRPISNQTAGLRQSDVVT